MLNFYMPKIIDDAPTIDAEPVGHGKWEEISSVRKIGKCNIPISKCVCCDFTTTAPTAELRWIRRTTHETIHDQKQILRNAPERMEIRKNKNEMLENKK